MPTPWLTLFGPLFGYALLAIWTNTALVLWPSLNLAADPFTRYSLFATRVLGCDALSPANPVVDPALVPSLASHSWPLESHGAGALAFHRPCC